jgi:hypothetical protein
MTEPTFLEVVESELVAVRRDLERRVDRLRALEDVHRRAIAAQAELITPVTVDALWSRVGDSELDQAEFGALLARCMDKETTDASDIA